MDRNRFSAVLLGTALLLGGCDFFDSALLPSLGGESSSSSAQPASNSPNTTQVNGVRTQVFLPPANTPGAAPQLGTGNFEPQGVTPGQPTGTAVGQKVEGLRGELAKLQTSIASENQTLQSLRAQAIQNALAYHQSVGAINAKLEVGTTPGNPILVKQWNDAQAQLNQVNGSLNQMNQLAANVSSSAAMSNYLLQATRATYNISGAVDEDHRQLTVLEDDVNKTTILIDRLLSELTEDIARQTNYLAEERGNLNTLAIAVNNGEAFGSSLASRAYAPPMIPTSAPGAGVATGRPLVVIRFDRPDVQYQQPLYQAVSQALARRPNAAFDLVAVAPSGGGTAQVALNSNMAQRDADQVLRSLISMGLSPDRVSMSSATSPNAQVNEVHLYVR
ncbi:MAG TPA: hypothetical protein VN821_16090 [Candidatus Udaeobacter sp.]|nr:hypothetical protein [Candidatus Udaeobacter sp.]